MLAQLDRTGEDQISLTTDSRAMAAHTRVAVGYNAQVAVDAKNKMIVEQAVTNHIVDMGLLTQTAGPARDILGVETIDVVGRLRDIEKMDYGARKPAAFVGYAHNAPTTFARCPVSKTRLCSIGWPNASKPGLRFSTVAARSSSTRSAA
jgi:hypothetical protein